MISLLKNKLQKVRSIKISRFDLTLLGIFILGNSVLLGLSIGFHTHRFSIEFAKANVMQLAVICMISFIIFYFTYQTTTKKKPSIWLLLILFIFFAATLYTISGLPYLLERLTHRGTFSIATSMVVLLTMLFWGLIVGRFDFPLIDSKEKVYLLIREHLRRNIGIYLVLAFVIAWAGFITGAFSYCVIFPIFWTNLYIAKILLSNFR